LLFCVLHLSSCGLTFRFQNGWNVESIFINGICRSVYAGKRVFPVLDTKKKQYIWKSETGLLGVRARASKRLVEVEIGWLGVVVQLQVHLNL
jgi:hypothetical protein